MISNKTFREMALALPDVAELPHFDKASFRVNKKIFATLNEAKNLGMVQLSPEEQYVYIKYDPDSFSPCTGAWGRNGSTWVQLKTVKKNVLKEAMAAAYNNLMKKKSQKKNQK